MTMNAVYAVLGLALLQYMIFGAAVGWARGRYRVEAPATTGHEVFERYFRAHMNTLELLVVFAPALLMFANYVNIAWAVGLGVAYVVGRTLYFLGYVRGPKQRSVGFLISWLPTVALLVGGLGGAVLATFRA